jgi:hypothetical protein
VGGMVWVGALTLCGDVSQSGQGNAPHTNKI